MDTPRKKELPLTGQGSAERVDAVRNRGKVMVAARDIVAIHGAEGLTMGAVAKEAGVGVGTIYRRFTDQAGLAHALLSEQEEQFQADFLHGPPPLGPGAAPDQRIRAFLHAYVDRLESESTLLLVAESNSALARFENGAYRLHHQHVAGLIQQLRPQADAHYLADALLAPLATAVYRHHTAGQGMSPVRIKAGLDELLAGVTCEHQSDLLAALPSACCSPIESAVGIGPWPARYKPAARETNGVIGSLPGDGWGCRNWNRHPRLGPGRRSPWKPGQPGCASFRLLAYAQLRFWKRL